MSLPLLNGIASRPNAFSGRYALVQYSIFQIEPLGICSVFLHEDMRKESLSRREKRNVNGGKE